MKCLKTLLFFSFIAIAITTKLVERETRLSEKTIVKLNNEGKYKLTIDKIDIVFYSGGASCKIIDGGPFYSSMSIQVTPQTKDVRTTAVIYGRMTSGTKGDISPSDITFVQA